MTGRPIHILLLEDELLDAELTVARLDKAELEYTVTRVDTREDFIVALERDDRPDVILADYALPDFDGLSALEIARDRAPAVPFIFVSGTLGEDAAIRSLRNGATDYILKHRLDRLAPAIQRAVADARLVAERERAEAAARALESRAHLALAAGNMSAWEYNPAADCFTWSLDAAELFYLDHAALTGRAPDFFAHVDPDDVPHVRRFLAMAAAGGNGTGIEFRVRRRDGAIGWLHFAARAVAATASPGTPTRIIGVGNDTTERRRTEEHLRTGQRLEALGRLAGGLAHEANNQMAVVLGFADFVLKRVDLPDAVRDDVEQIRRAAERTASVTSKLLAFSRQRPVTPIVVDANAIVTGFVPVLTRTAGSAIAVTADLRATQPIRIDANQLEQVLLNLAINAVDAMPDGGRLTISSCDDELDETFLHGRGIGSPRPGRYVRISVTDTGTGMRAETLERIFEPFYTTKPVGKGSGLGLAAVYGIIKQADGYVWATSEFGVGTVFDIYLPAMEWSPATVDASAVDGIPRGSEIILVVEDEVSVREVARRTLEKAGYQIVEAEHGTDALATLERGEDIDLVITDVSMPYVGGIELAERVRAARPELPVVLMSGYPDGRTGTGVAKGATGVAAFLQKPFTPERLLEVVRTALDDVATSSS